MIACQSKLVHFGARVAAGKIAKANSPLHLRCGYIKHIHLPSTCVFVCVLVCVCARMLACLFVCVYVCMY